MKCRKCGANPETSPGWLERVNAKGQPGIWECRPSCDSLPMPQDDALSACLDWDEDEPETDHDR